MRVVTGSFHPHLECALAEELRRAAQDRSLLDVTVVVPNKALRRYLAQRLPSKYGLTLLGSEILTLHQFSLSILRGSDFSDELAAPLAGEEWVRAELRGRDYPQAYRAAAEAAGGAGALIQTLRELEEGHLEDTDGHPSRGSVPADEPAPDPGAVSKSLRGTATLPPHLAGLDALYQSYRRVFREEVAGGSLTRLVWNAIRRVPDSEYVRRLRALIYYGVYDLTGVQALLLRTVGSAVPETVLFAPLVRDALPCRYAERKLERELGIAAGEWEDCGTADTVTAAGPPISPGVVDRMFEPQAPGPPRPAERFSVTVAPGTEAEVEAAASRIRTWLDDRIAPHRIGVLARSLEGYEPHVTRLFGEAHIPFVMRAPASPGPVARAHLLMLQCIEEDLPLRAVLDLALTPWSRAQDFAKESPGGGVGSWERLAREAGVSFGWETWRGLQRFESRKEDEWRGWSGLLSWADAIRRGGRKIRAAPSWPRARAAFLALRDELLDLEALRRDESFEQTARILEIVGKGAWGHRGDSPEGTEPRPPLDPARYLEALSRALSAPERSGPDLDREGVRVLDVMTARGFSFDAVILLGLNEGMFPRVRREDPFLRDPERHRLNRQGRFALALAQESYEEERQLFWIALGSAERQLVLSYRRSDDEGQPLLQSWYLDELERRLVPGAVTQIPLAHSARLEESGHLARLSPQLWAAGQALRGRLPRLAADLQTARLGHQIDLDHLDSERNRWDGKAGRPAAYWTRVLERGVSPSALKTYGRCPFQFFAGNILKLEPLGEAPPLIEPDGPFLGRYLHSLLHEVLAEVTGPESSPGRTPTPEKLREIVASTSERAYFRALEFGPLHTGLLRRHAERIVQALAFDYLAQEIPRIEREKSRPLAFERTAACALPSELPALAGDSPRLFGVIDRLDLLVAAEESGPAEKGDRLEIIDYKYVGGRNLDRQQRNPSDAAVQGKDLQLPLYFHLARRLAEEENLRPVSVRASLHFLGPRIGVEAKQTIEEEDWKGPDGEKLEAALAWLLGGIRAGEFPLIPESSGGYCSWCDYSTACRRNHGPTRYRLKGDPIAHGFDELSQAKAESETRGRRPR